ncbi:SAM MT RSMB NOP domain-containing protein [Abeliophyllum distichum]|uniref:SAM MT RSMB NOP domain-containing protein n=1 Tax=Abeliophyllum distichum TaxID=126358 RepID=A0ABD1QID8_9LAMI
MSNSKPIVEPYELLGEVEQGPESIESNGLNKAEGDIQQHQKKKVIGEKKRNLSNVSAHGGNEENPSVTKNWKKNKSLSRPEISKAREEKRQTLREAKRKAKMQNRTASRKNRIVD